MRFPTRSTRTPWILQVFGGVRIYRNGNAIALAPKEVLLLALLALSVHRRMNRRLLIHLMWDAGREEVLRRRLSQACYSLRHRMRPLNPILSEGDELYLNPDVIRTDLELIEAAARKGDLTTIEEMLTRTLVVPVHWPPDDARVRQWLIPVLTLRSRVLSRHLARYPGCERMKEVLRIWWSFADLVLWFSEAHGSRRPVPIAQRAGDFRGVETWRRFLADGLTRDLRRGNKAGLARFLSLISRSHALLPAFHRARAGFRALWSLRAHWEEGTGGGRDALHALREQRTNRDPAGMAELLALILPVFEIEGMLGATPWHLEIMQEVEGVVRWCPHSRDEKKHQDLVRALLIRWRLMSGYVRGAAAKRVEVEVRELRRRGDSELWLVCQESLALSALQTDNPSEARRHFSLLLQRAVAVGDRPATAIAVGGLLAVGAVMEGDVTLPWVCQALDSQSVPRRARAMLQAGYAQFLRLHSGALPRPGDLDRNDA